MKIELPKNWKEIAGTAEVTYQRAPEGKVGDKAAPVLRADVSEQQKALADKLHDWATK